MITKLWANPALLAFVCFINYEAKAQLSVINQQVLIEVGDGFAPRVTSASATATDAIRTSSAFADLSTGALRVRAFVPTNDALLARASFLITIRNDGTQPIGFAAGAISAILSVNLAQTLGADPLGGFGKVFQSSLAVEPATSYAGISYTHGGRGGLGDLSVQPADVSAGASTVITTATMNALAATLHSSAFTVAPGGVFTVQFAIDGQSNGSPGYSALVDATNAQISMVLPPGVTLSSPVPLQWVTSSAQPSRLVNMSIRSTAGTGAQTLIVGMVIGGLGSSGFKSLLIRGIGPALASFGVATPLADPVLSVYAGNTLVNSNDNWSGDAQITTVGSAVGAFPLTPLTSKDAALYTSALSARDYTIQITGAGGTTGVALAEIYDASPSGFPASTPQLVNVSARTQVGTGPDILIAGFNISGTTPRTVLIRAIGPTLSAFSVTGVLLDPQLALFSGATATVPATRLQENNDWGTAANVGQIGTTTAQLTFALAANSKDSVILTSLSPGSYTAQVSGVGNSTGVALVEIYLVP